MNQSQISYINPLTFEIVTKTKEGLVVVLNEVLERTRNEITSPHPEIGPDLIENISNTLATNMKPAFHDIPFDPAFPSFFTSLFDYSITTAGVGVALVVQCLLEGKKFSSSNDILSRLLDDRKGIIQIVRLLSFLHSIHRFSCDTLGVQDMISPFLGAIGLDTISNDLVGILEGISGQESVKDSPLQAALFAAINVAKSVRAPISRNHKKVAEALKRIRNRGFGSKYLDQVIEIYEKENIPKNLPENIGEILPIDSTHHKEIVDSFEEITDALGIDKRPIAVLLMEAESIQSIVRRTESLKGLVGFSALVELGVQNAAKIIHQQLAKECEIYQGGGGFMALVPSGQYEELVTSSTQEYVNTIMQLGTLKAPFDADKMTIGLHELIDGPDYTWDINLEKVENIPFRTFSRIFYAARSIMEPVTNDFYLSAELQLNPGDRCPTCGMEEAIFDDSIPPQRKPGAICSRAEELTKSIRECLGQMNLQIEDDEVIYKGVSNSKYASLPTVRIYDHALKNLRNRLEKDLVYELLDLENGALEFNPIDDLNEFGLQIIRAANVHNNSSDIRDYRPEDEMGTLAVISGDGDNFGLVKSNMATISQYRHVSELLEQVIVESLGSAFGGVILKQLQLRPKSKIDLPFITVYSGGDDFLILLDAAAILLFLHELKKYLIDEIGGKKDSFEPKTSINYLGLSLGAAITGTKTALNAALDAADELMDRAKKFAKTKKNEYGSDFTLALHRFSGIPSKNEIRVRFKGHERHGMKVKFTNWPRTSESIFGDEMVGLIRNLLNVEVTSGTLQRVLREQEERHPKETKLILKYKSSREMKSTDEGRQMTDKSEIFSALADKYEIHDNQANYIFLDLIDVMSIIDNQIQLLPEDAR